MKLVYSILLISLLTLMLPGCTHDGNRETTRPETTTFGQILGFVPYSVLAERDIFFSNPGLAKKLDGLEDVDSIAQMKATFNEKRDSFVRFAADALNGMPNWWLMELKPVTGFDMMMVDRTVSLGNVPPRISYFAQGNMDEELIGKRLAEIGYKQTVYGKNSYYAIREDYEIDLKNSPLTKFSVLADMNRIAAFDNNLIISPATADVTGIFDAMKGKTGSVIDNPV